MSFSSNIKEYLVRIRVKSPAHKQRVLAGITLTCGSLFVGRGGAGIVYHTESLPVGKYIVSLATAMYELDSTMELTEQERRKRPLTVVTLTGGDARRLMLETGFLIREGDGTLLADHLPDISDDEEGQRAFLRGLFLGCGSCANPHRGYHLELVLRTRSMADDLVALIGHYPLTARVHRRADKEVVYLKGDDVSGFLALIGANNAALAFENERAVKEFRNYVNRTNNCETANIGKTVDAGLLQIRAIETIERTMDLSRLPTPLYEAAMLRLNHPDASLQTLADMADIGKSGMNHRFTRLIRMAEEIEHG